MQAFAEQHPERHHKVDPRNQKEPKFLEGLHKDLLNVGA